jgi:hypothetical protein
MERRKNGAQGEEITREEKKWRGIGSTSAIGSATARPKNGSGFRHFWACGNIGQQFRERVGTDVF